MFEKAKFNRLKTIILKSITKDIDVLIRNELLCIKDTLANKLSDEIYKKEKNMLREEFYQKKVRILSSKIYLKQ